MKSNPLWGILRRSFLIISILGINVVHAQWYTGISNKTGLALCIHLTDSAVDLYSPMQTADPIPVSSWSREGNRLTLECNSIGLKIDLTQHDSTFSGFWKQSIIKEEITFYPTDTIFSLLRPQTPQPPYPYLEETVTTDYTDSQGNKVHLEGTLTYPKEGERFPCLVLVSGSGQQNRDEEIMQHKPFWVIADYLARRDIAVLRYDDRGMGASTGEVEKADTRLFSEDAEAMFNTVKVNPHIDPARLGIGGHSEGGAIAPMVAARNKEVKFVVMLAGQGCTGLDVMLQQNEAIFRAKGVRDSLIACRMAYLREAFAMPPTASAKEHRKLIEHYTASLSKEQADSIGLVRSSVAGMRSQLESKWMQTFLTLDPAEYLPKVTCPILALQGMKDCQVIALPNITRITELAGNKTHHEIFAGLNHLFQHCTTGSPDEYMLIEETFAPEAMKAIADFIDETK